METLGSRLKKAGIPFKGFFFRGHCIGSSSGFPQETGSYKTVVWGELQRFKMGADQVHVSKETWKKIWSIRDGSSPEEPGALCEVYVPVKYSNAALKLALERKKDYYQEKGGCVSYYSPAP